MTRTVMLRATASRLLSFSACLWMLITVAQADKSSFLKGVTTVTYRGLIENKERCWIDQKAWNTEIDFVANLSTKLKLIKDTEYQKYFEGLLFKNSLTKTTPRTNEEIRKSIEENESIRKQAAIPDLIFHISNIEMQDGCSAKIKVEVKAALEDSKMISTGAIVHNPNFSIWSETRTIQSLYQSFSKLAIGTSERMMKDFVNDWAASQTLP